MRFPRARALLLFAAAAASLNGPAKASTVAWELHSVLHRAGLVALIRVDSIRVGKAEAEGLSPCGPSEPSPIRDTADTVFGTFSNVLKSDLGRWPVRPGRAVAFLRFRSETLPWSRGRTLRAGDSLLTHIEHESWSWPYPQAVPLDDPARLPVYKAVLAHEGEWPEKIADLIRDAGRFDADVSPSALHELSRMGPRASSAHGGLLGLMPKAAAADRLADIGLALWATGLPSDSLRTALQNALDGYGPSRNKDVIGLLAMLGPGSLPRLAIYAASDPDEWVRLSAIRALCDPAIRGPAARAIASRAASEEKTDFVRHGARKILQECYGGPPVD